MMDWFSEFLYMDGFAVWVWSAFGVSALVMGLMVWLVIRRHREALRLVRRYHSDGGSR
ncbi:heme exporter protein CcmD [Gammaproteobacteria bacterium AB-CW1]|uniref:Heme exporter protein D n=2 Tax=Natronospira TaxID=2024969 RepID=A0AAP6MK71_9GAMM|nr:heme exporter protein CcmD [Gammaproteobacteria bacterium AB-CW1]